MVSVIVAIYNIEAYLRECVESICSQTYSDLQIILVDDGSSDGSGEICDYYRNIDSRVVVIHKENGGLVSARKAGLRAAVGEYVWFVDGDDYVDRDMVESLLNQAKQYDADMVHSGYYDDEKTNVRWSYAGGVMEMDPYQKETFIGEYILGDHCKISPSIWSKLFRSNIARKAYSLVPDTLSYGEDLLCLCAAVCFSHRIYIVNDAYYHYRKRETSITNRRNIYNIEEKVRLLKELTVLFSELNMKGLTNALESFYRRDVIQYIKKDLYLNLNTYICTQYSLLRGKKIIIYGAGVVGQSYYAQLCKYTDITIVAWVDKQYKDRMFDYCEVQSPEMIMSQAFDYIVLAIMDETDAMKIRDNLLNLGVPDNEILWSKPEIGL
ncbi:MAG: glycosyltransferase family 2 protein [Lachnospiraceae bacterium]|nr:glycosyltransferase family 2 protein [Lachnospiraceae bacterium]